MNKKLLLSAISVLSVSAAAANASGFQLTEASTVALGRAFAGAGVVGDDLSAIAYNAAGSGLFNGTVGAQAGITAINLKGNFNGTVTKSIPAPSVTNDSDRADTTAFVPHFYAIGRVNDRLNIGLGVHTPFGLETNYDRHWAGAPLGLRSYLATVDINPSASYRLTDKLTAGLGLSAQYLEATLTNNDIYPLGYVKVKGDSWAYGYDFGFMYEPVKNTRLGISYRSKMNHKVKGTTFNSLTGETDGTNAKVVLPETVTLSAYHLLNDKIGLSATGRWTHWSRFDELTVYSASPVGVSSTPEKWHNTWSISGGIDVYALPDLTLRFGLGYDKAPIKNRDYRTPRIPDNDRLQLGLGLSYKLNDNVTFDFGYMHLFMRTAHISHSNSTGTVNIEGKYRPHADLFSAAVQVKF